MMYIKYACLLGKLVGAPLVIPAAPTATPVTPFLGNSVSRFLFNAAVSFMELTSCVCYLLLYCPHLCIHESEGVQ